MTQRTSDPATRGRFILNRQPKINRAKSSDGLTFQNRALVGGGDHEGCHALIKMCLS